MSGQVRTLRDGVLTIGDDASGSSIELKLDEGNLSWTETIHPTIQISDRGVLDSIRKGDEVPITLNFGVKFQTFVGNTVDGATLREALKGTGQASDWTSAAEAEFPEGFACELVFVIDKAGDSANSEAITFDKFVCETLEFSEGDEFDILTVSGYCFITAPEYATKDNS